MTAYFSDENLEVFSEATTFSNQLQVNDAQFEKDQQPMGSHSIVSVECGIHREINPYFPISNVFSAEYSGHDPSFIYNQFHEETIFAPASVGLSDLPLITFPRNNQCTMGHSLYPLVAAEDCHVYMTPRQQMEMKRRQQRANATTRERNRMRNLDRAFQNLAKHVPYLPINRKASKQEVLSGAIKYITQLQKTLSFDVHNRKQKKD